MKTLISARLLSTHRADPQPKPYEIWDRDLRGFVLRVQPSGTRAYIVQIARGRRVTLGTVGAMTPTQARERAKKVLGNVAHNRAPLAGLGANAGLSLGDFIERNYMPWANVNRPRSADNTLGRLNRCFRKWSHKALAEITTELVEGWKAGRLAEGLAPTTVVRDVAALSAVLSRAVKMGKLDHNPMGNVDKPRIDRRPRVRYLSAEEENRLRSALTERDEEAIVARKSANEWRRERRRELLKVPERFSDHLTPAVLLSMNTGLRRGELLALTWADIDFQERLLTVRGASSKSGDTRYLPLNDEALTLLRDWKKNGLDADRVFSVTTSFKTAWGALLERAKIVRFRWHDLRHHFASRLVQSGVPLNTVRELLGHGSLTMTLRYAHLAPNQTREAVAKLGEIRVPGELSPEL
jgi:integrase